MSLLVVGSVALDSVETPFEKREEILGGSASFFCAVAGLLSPTRVVAVVGDDFPEEHVELLASGGNDLEGLQRVQGRTFRWSGRYLENMVDRETLDTQLNVFETFRPQLPASYADSRYIFLANILPSLQLDVLDQIDAPKCVASDTMNFWITDAHIEALKRVIARSQVVIVNDEEARLLSGEHNLVDAAESIIALGADRVIVKRGDAGAMLFDQEGIFWAPAFPLRRVVDPTGAGDSFAAGFMAYLARTDDISPANMRRAMIVGSATGSLAVEAFSVDRFRTLTLDQLQERCQAFAQLTRFSPIAL
ncbi:MAG: bifunctional hydroxymethylpyrimidine kinase/phosphomethylpyrimidine kinase [Deltaproteobacteria bacterium]|nr:bifunctional hydroxymethylpyrimidine kinase/phosphomethylpyrimidine kinase [Deltaproteobacteria bacterium]